MKAMPRQFVWSAGLVAAAFITVVAVVFGTDLVRGKSTEVGRDIEMKAQERLVRLIVEGHVRSDFATDGCSGGLSSAWRSIAEKFPELARAHEFDPPWESCCVAHDRIYHAAGDATEAQQSYALRLAADEALRECVFDTRLGRIDALTAEYGLSEAQIQSAYRLIADTMFEAVRIGGVPCSGLAWRWGYGYPQCFR
jgi:hypothetical protein